MTTRHLSFYLALGLMFCAANSVFAQESPIPWWNDAVFYEVFVRSFADSDSDGIGDLRGLMGKLSYLNTPHGDHGHSLGVTALWIMPIFPSPSYHGYDVTDYRDVNKVYGTKATFRALVDSAHAHGIRVILDFVMNHTSEEHPWFQQSASDTASPYRAWYRWRNDDPGTRGEWGQRLWHPYKKAFYYGIFLGGLADLNLTNPPTREAILDDAAFWLDSMHVDGFRLDAIKYLVEEGTSTEDAPGTFLFLKDFRNRMKQIRPDEFTVGEVWTRTSRVAPYATGEGVDMCFEFQTAETILQAIRAKSPQRLLAQMDSVVKAYPPLQYATFLTNHDIDRVGSALGGDPASLRLAASVLLTLPGVPFLYYGEELGMTGAGQDPLKRTPMQWTGGHAAGFTAGTPWEPVNEDYRTRNLAVQQRDKTSLWHWYRELIHLRRSHEALRRGEYQPAVFADSSLYAFVRSTTNETLLVIHNFSATTAAVPRIVLPAGLVAGGTWNGRELLSGRRARIVATPRTIGAFVVVSGIAVAPRGTLVLPLRRPVPAER